MVKKKSKMAKQETIKVKKVKPTDVGKEEKKKASQASDELAAYLTANNLDPTKDWTKDPKHGKRICELMQVVRVNREKLDAKTDEVKIKNLKKPKVGVEKGEKVPRKQPLAYDYPEVDGKPMPTLLRKKYRAKMRALLKSNMEPKEAIQKATNFVMGISSEVENRVTAKAAKAEKETPAAPVEKASKKDKKDKKKKGLKKVKPSTREED